MPIESASYIQPVTLIGQQARFPQPQTADELPQGETPLAYSQLTLTKVGTTVTTSIRYDNPVVKDPGTLALTQPLMERMLGGPLPGSIPTAAVSPARQVLTAKTPTVLPQPDPPSPPIATPNRLTPNSVQRISPLSPIVSPVVSVVPQIPGGFPVLASPGANTPVQPLGGNVTLPALLASAATGINAQTPSRFDSHLWSQQRAGQVVGLPPWQVPQVWELDSQAANTGQRATSGDGGQALSDANDKANQQANGRFRPAGVTVAPFLAGNVNALDLLNPALYKTLSPNQSGWQA
jgi:hypothetical protein